MRHAADDTPLLVRKESDRGAWVPWLAIALALSLIGVVVLAILLANASSSSSPTPAPPTPAPWNPADYQSAAQYYENVKLHGIEIDDNMRLLRVGAPILSANGRAVVFTVTQAQMPDFQKRTTTLWSLQLAQNEVSWLNTTAAPVQLTRPEWGVSDSSPQWGPDDKSIFYLSNRGNGVNQIWQATADHLPVWPNFLASTQVSNLPIDIDNMLISPKFDLVMFSVQIYANMTIPESIAYDKARADFGGNFKTFNRLYVRHWDTWVEKRNQIFAASLTVPAKASSPSVTWGEYVNIVNMDSDTPTRPFGDSGEWSFSPDGKKFVFCRQHDELRDVSWNTNDDIFMVDILQATNPPVITFPINLTPNNFARDTLPRFSPDGSKIAYLSMAVPGYESDRLRVKIYDVLTKTVTNLTEAWNYSVDSVTWSSNGTYLMGTVLQDGEEMLQRIPLQPSTEGDHVITEGNVANPVQTVRGEWLFGFQTWLMPNEIHATDGVGKHAKAVQISKFNTPILAKCQTAQTSKFFFNGANNETVNGWITLPVGYEPGNLYPVAYLIHGGPQGAWEQSWSWRWNPQIYAGAGYAVVMVNFHGSTGYGQNFTDSIQGNYGSLPFEDLMKGIDYALNNFNFLDRNRVAALGASYGGYMIYWIAGQAKDNNRFKCLVAHDGMFDIRTFYYSTEELFFPEHDQPGVPYLNPENYEKYNPINHVANWSLPMLVIHGGLDYRITDSQGLGAFTALQRLGIKSQLLYFPTENHWVLNGRNQKTWHNNVLKFIDECTK